MQCCSPSPRSSTHLQAFPPCTVMLREEEGCWECHVSQVSQVCLTPTEEGHGAARLPGQEHSSASGIHQFPVHLAVLSAHPSFPRFPHVHLPCPSLSDPRLLQFLLRAPYFTRSCSSPAHQAVPKTHLTPFTTPSDLLEWSPDPPRPLLRKSSHLPSVPYNSPMTSTAAPPNCLRCQQAPLTISSPKEPFSICP